MDELKQHISEEELAAISRIPIIALAKRDKRILHYERRGRVTVKSVYHFLRAGGKKTKIIKSSSSAYTDTATWEMVWNIDAAPKLKHFLWKVISGILPFQNALAKIRVATDSCLCSFMEKRRMWNMLC